MLIHRTIKVRIMTLIRPLHPLFQSAIIVFIIFSYPSPQQDQGGSSTLTALPPPRLYKQLPL